MRRRWNILLLAVILLSGAGDHQLLLVSCTMDNCWEGVNPSNCIINAKFHNINTYDVHIQCTAEDEGRDSGDRFGKVHHAELNGCLTNKYTNPFELLPMNMHNLKKLTLKEFYIGELSLNDKSGPFLPKLEELILMDNVIIAYASDFFQAQSIKSLKGIQFAGGQTRTPSMEQLRGIAALKSLTIREGDVLLNYEIMDQLDTLSSLEIYSSRVAVTTPIVSVKSIKSLILEDTEITNCTHILEAFGPFHNLTELKIRNTTLTNGNLNVLDLQSVLNAHPQLSSLILQKQNLTKLTISLATLAESQMKSLDISYNELQDIDWDWNASLVDILVHRMRFKLLIDHNPWQCEFFQKSNEEELFEYEKDYHAINVRGIKCKHNSTLVQQHSHRPLDLNNMWLLYGCVLSSLLLIISVTYLIFAMCRSRRGRREPFYRSLAKWKTAARTTVPDMSLRKLPPTTYEIPLQYRTIEFKSEDNCEIYEEIPAHATGQTLQVII